MKTKKLLLALTLPMAFAACSNEEFIENNATPAEGNLVELGEGFVLAAQGSNGTSTRGVWESGSDGLGWSWLPTILANNNGANSKLGAKDVVADEIGLCWTGELPDGTGSISNMVYTNYQFLHDGWLAKGEATADFEICSPFELKNGKIYKDIVEGALDETSDLTTIKTQLADAANKVDINGVDTELNLNTGVFKTSNKAIFGGSYIAYYPYNNEFADAASLPAKSTVVYDDVVANDVTAAHVAKNTFMVGYAQNLIGGAQASKLSLNPLSAIISLQLKQTAGSPKTVTKVALWSQNSFVKSVGLDASKIKSLGATAGEGLYTGTKETASTIIANIKGSGEPLAVVAKKFYLPVLPTTAKDLKVIVYANDGSIAVISLGEDYTFKAAQGTVVAVDMVEADFKEDVLVAVDETSLAAAVASGPATITVIGDITLTNNLSIADKVTVEGGKIIVPEDVTLTLKDGSTIKSTVDVQGQTCCGGSAAGGEMSVEAATIAGEVNILTGYTDKEAGSLTFVDTKTSTVSGTINNFGAVTVGSNISATQTLVKLTGTINNNGTLDIKKGATGTTTEDAKVAVLEGGNFNNKVDGVTTVEGVLAVLPGKASNEGTIYDKVSSQITGNISDLNGEYVCDVDDNGTRFDAALNERPTTIIRFVKASSSFNMNKVTGSVRASKITKYVVSATGVKFTANDGIDATNNLIAVTISNLEVEAAKDLTISTDNSAADALNLTVTGTVDVAGTMTIGESKNRDVEVFSAGNVTVISSTTTHGALTFMKNVKSTLTNLTINGINEQSASASDSGSATFELNSITTVTGAIVNKGYGLIKLASGGNADVSARVWYDAIAPTGNGLWANGTPTKVVK